MSNVKMIRMLNVKQFDVHYLDVKCQNDIMSNVKQFDVRHSNVECPNDRNVKCQTV